jgi:hypothetical protein
MFINSQVGLLSPEKLANYAVLAACLSNRWGSVCGIIQVTMLPAGSASRWTLAGSDGRGRWRRGIRREKGNVLSGRNRV